MSCYTFPMKNKAYGFTLVELMVAIAVAAILLAIAVPNFSSALKANRVQSQTRELYSNLTYARSEAVSRGKMVTICHSSNGSSCGGTWSNGWIICDDTDRNSSCGTGETVLRKYNDLGTNTLKLVDDGAPAVALDTISFKADGSTSAVNKMSFVLCDAAGDLKYARAVLKAGSGQLLMSTMNSSTGVYKDVNGAALTCP